MARPEEVRKLAHSLVTLRPEGIRCAKIKLTSRCNLRCQMCRYWQTRDEEALSTAEWRRVLDELSGLGCRKVHFSGGEVLLRPDFLDLVEHAAGLRMKVNLTTNGTLMTPEVAKRLVRAGTNSVSLSLDGPRQAIHDAVRGVAGSFRRTCRAVRLLQRHGDRLGRRPKIRLNFVVMRENARWLPEMVDLAARLEAVELYPMPVDEKGGGRRRLSRSRIEWYNREVAPRVLEARARHGLATEERLVYPFGRAPGEIAYAKKGDYARGFYESKSCLAPFLHAYFGWDGEAWPCCMTSRRMPSLGSVRASAVGEVFGGERWRAVRSAFLRGQHHPACHRCDMFLEENRVLHHALSVPGGLSPP